MYISSRSAKGSAKGSAALLVLARTTTHHANRQRWHRRSHMMLLR